jgi:galactoside 2-L-fucosyltransferase 1/2
MSEQIRKEFTFRKTVEEQVEDFFKHTNMSGSDIVKVGIHIRRKQLNNTSWIQKGFGPPPNSYYYNAMKYFLEKYKNVYFIVCSDDLAWTKRNIVGDNVIHVPGHSAGVDMAILASCDHVIISNGTYSWWAGWLCRGTTVRYKQMPNNNTRLYKSTRGEHWPPEGDNSHYVAIDS